MSPQEFKQLRRSLKLSQEALGEMLNISKRQVINLEQGKTPIKQLYIDALLEFEKIQAIKKAPETKRSLPQNHISEKEAEILEAYRILTQDEQEIFFYELKAAAAKARKKAKETNISSSTNAKSAI